MDGQPGQEDGEGAGPDRDPGLPGRDPRLAGFARDDSRAAPAPSGRMAVLVDELSVSFEGLQVP